MTTADISYGCKLSHLRGDRSEILETYAGYTHKDLGDFRVFRNEGHFKEFYDHIEFDYIETHEIPDSDISSNKLILAICLNALGTTFKENDEAGENYCIVLSSSGDVYWVMGSLTYDWTLELYLGNILRDTEISTPESTKRELVRLLAKDTSGIAPSKVLDILMENLQL